MTRQTTASQESRPEVPSARGTHDTSNYVTVFLAIQQRRLDGMLETGNRRGWRRLYFLDGEVVGFTSSFTQDQIGRTLSTAGLVPKARIQWFEERLEPNEHIETALLASCALTPAQLEEHDLTRIRQGIAAPLRASRGTWVFEPSPGLDAATISPGLRPELSSIGALWQGVRQHVAVDKILPEVTDPSLGSLLVAEGLRDLLPAMELDPTLAFLGEAIGDGISVEELFKQIPDRSGNLLKLVWMLECGGLLLRQDKLPDHNIQQRLLDASEAAQEPGCARTLLAWVRDEKLPPPSVTADPDPQSRPPITVQPVSPGSPTSDSVERTAPLSTAPRTARDPVSSTTQARLQGRRGGERPMTPARVAADHGKRMGRDFYGFLGLKAGCPRDVVNRRCKHMLNRWQSAKELELDPEGERQLAQLLHGLQIVYQTLTHGERKTEYDRRLEQGHAPRVADIRQALEGLETALPADTSRVSVTPITPEGEGDDLDTARTLIARGAFLPATKLLERLRRKQPSSPDVLSELGWAVWKAKGRAAKGENDPEDFVALALTFAPDHPKALEYHARIAFERGDHDGVQERIDRLLVVDKQNAWTLEVLASDALPTSSRRTSGGGLRFWRRNSD